MAYRPPYVDPGSIMLDPPHPALLDDAELAAQCEETFGRTGGPGGQHRNKVETGVRIVHVPSGVEQHAAERRSREINRSRAMFRLRLKLATRVRTPTSRDRHQPSQLWCSRRQGTKLPVAPTHRDYPALLAEALDVIVARRWDMAGAAGILGVTMSQLSRLVRHDRHAFARLNEGRESVGLQRLRS